jgi:uncharacterized protein YcfJ
MVRAQEGNMVRFVRVLGLGLGLAVAGSAAAWHDNSDTYRDTRYEWARVVSVDPIIDQYREPVAREVCYTEPVHYYEPRHGYYRRDTTGPTLLGAVIGGALGNTIGKGDGRKAATIAGAVIGGSIAHDSARRHGSGYYYERGGYAGTAYEERCRVRTDYRESDRVDGYDVAYEFRGRVYHTTTDYHPGRRIQIEIDERGRPLL